MQIPPQPNSMFLFDPETYLPGRLWPVYETYNVIDEVVTPSGDPRYYNPLEIQSLPTEFAKIDDCDKRQAARFATDYGLLSYRLSIREPNDLVGDPLSFVWDHSSNVARLLKLIRALSESVESKVSAAIDAFLIPSQDSLLGARQLAWPAYTETHNRLYVREDTDTKVGYQLLADVTNSNISRTSLRFVPGASEQDGGRLTRSLHWSTLLEVIYWHLGSAAAGARELADCRFCGALFVKTDGRQIFCPPNGIEIENHRTGKRRTRPQSRCLTNFSQQTVRARRASKKE